ncbi:PilZ domain-containing protein [Novosphingobium piscinae]|uniref:PilZ domain-containing protein n=1 Tax=Novosphingobium piscinae TaxID=1507448 RepID=A0A7X1KNU8_9SPHN|nr:PilZ domain-containing protein [Novosphingobium piscinae]MBC2668069.1 PilZ domain-containing protein [Novosphingobium piscinae]
MTGDSYFHAAQEDRCAPRTRVGIPAVLRASGGRAFQTVVHDLSLGGFCCSAVNRMSPDTICWITLPGLQSLQSRVIWWDASLVGCAFDNLLSPVVLENILARWQHETTLRSAV